MFFAQATETVTAVANGSAISVHLSTTVALKLGLRTKAEDRLSIEYATGRDAGKLRLGRARQLPSSIPTHPVDGGVSINLNPFFIPDAKQPRERVVLPHDLRGPYVLIDVSPLRTRI